MQALTVRCQWTIICLIYYKLEGNKASWKLPEWELVQLKQSWGYVRICWKKSSDIIRTKCEMSGWLLSLPSHSALWFQVPHLWQIQTFFFSWDAKYFRSETIASLFSGFNKTAVLFGYLFGATICLDYNYFYYYGLIERIFSALGCQLRHCPFQKRPSDTLLWSLPFPVKIAFPALFKFLALKYFSLDSCTGSVLLWFYSHAVLGYFRLL